MSKKHKHEQPQVQTEKAKVKAGKTGVDEALAASQAQVKELEDKLLRAYAEMDNLRKRARRDMEQANRFAIEKFAGALLEIVDNLERALAIESGSVEGLRQGVQLTLNKWHEVMRKFGMERIDALGVEFDPHIHEALAQVPHTKAAGTVVAQHEAGYKLHERLLRPARVIVSSGPPAEPGKEQETDEAPSAD